MATSEANATATVRTRTDERTLTLLLGDLRVQETAAIWPEAMALLSASPRPAAVLDLAEMRTFDSTGLVFVASLQRWCREHTVECRLEHAPRHFTELLEALAPAEAKGPPAAAVQWTTVPELVGTLTVEAADAIKQALSFIGDLTLAAVAAIRRPQDVRLPESLWYMQQCGANALPIVALICFLMGVITAFQAAVQLHDFGADIFVANLVGLSITRELGPLMVGIVCAGRSGAAFAAEIGTMKVGEEVDALVTMGLDPQRFLVIPKVIGLVVALPCLTLLGDVIGIFGGLLVSKAVLDLPASAYMRQTLTALSYGDVFGGLLKTVAFALLVAGVGCFYGMRTERNAQSVGRMTTAAVVSGIFLIILADTLFAVLFHAMGI